MTLASFLYLARLAKMLLKHGCDGPVEQSTTTSVVLWLSYKVAHGWPGKVLFQQQLTESSRNVSGLNTRAIIGVSDVSARSVLVIESLKLAHDDALRLNDGCSSDETFLQAQSWPCNVLQLFV